MKQDMILILDLGSEENPRLAREIRPLVDGYYLITPAARPSVGADIVGLLRKEFQ